MIYQRLFDYPFFSIRNPFEQLERMKRQMDRLFDGLPEKKGYSVSAGVFPLINLTEDSNKYYIRAELPGIESSDLEIQATAKSLSITGERRIPTETDSVQYHRREREAGKFSRVISMPTEIDADKIEARMEDGILTVFIPKSEAAKPRQISIS